VDLSGLIFVALAVAWAAYLIPKALRHHDDVERGRSIDRFSHGMRVLARREPVSARQARLVETPTRRAAMVDQAPVVPTADEQYAARRAATRQATRRRRRVLALLLLAAAGVVAAAVAGRLGYPYVAFPAVLLAAWLLACRLMVRKERAWRPVERADLEDAGVDDTRPAPEASAAPARPQPDAPRQDRDPKLWDPVPVTLPTYVSKPPARRAVRTIDLDATGVWTSGRSETDSALAREAEAAEAAERVRRRRATRKDDGDDAAVGS
jgi:hypothetical protein